MDDFFSRTENLIGNNALLKIRNSKVAVFGLGGVGGYTVEALVRAGVGNLILIDSDNVEPSNLNRQIIATRESLGKAKTLAAKERALSINPEVNIEEKTLFFSEDTVSEVDFSGVDYIADAIDSVKSKVFLIKFAHDRNIPIISCMGAGNKLDPTRFKISSISKTEVCPLAKAVRKELKKHGNDNFELEFLCMNPRI